MEGEDPILRYADPGIPALCPLCNVWPIVHPKPFAEPEHYVMCREGERRDQETAHVLVVYGRTKQDAIDNWNRVVTKRPRAAQSPRVEERQQ